MESFSFNVFKKWNKCFFPELAYIHCWASFVLPCLFPSFILHYSILKTFWGNVNILWFCASKEGRLKQSYLGRVRQESRRQTDEALGVFGGWLWPVFKNNIIIASSLFPPSSHSTKSSRSPAQAWDAHPTPQALTLSFGELLVGWWPPGQAVLCKTLKLSPALVFLSQLFHLFLLGLESLYEWEEIKVMS